MGSPDSHDVNELTKCSDTMRKMLYSSFPPAVYLGEITSLDNDPFPQEIFEGNNIYDEEEELYDNLKGKQWTDISDDVIARNEQGYLFLTDEAYAAFLPAWLLRSLDNLGDENRIREYLIYSFGPKAGGYSYPWGIANLNKQQRRTLRLFLENFLVYEASSFIREGSENLLQEFDKMEANLADPLE
jgi:hypothetical protein